LTGKKGVPFVQKTEQLPLPKLSGNGGRVFCWFAGKATDKVDGKRI
jgi:hypothetical protein